MFPLCHFQAKSLQPSSPHLYTSFSHDTIKMLDFHLPQIVSTLRVHGILKILRQLFDNCSTSVVHAARPFRIVAEAGH